MHSLGYALGRFDADIVYVCPDDMAPTDDYLGELSELGVRIERAGHVRDAIDRADVIYMEPVVQADYTASREERGGGAVSSTPDAYRVDAALLAEHAPGHSIVLHSLPRMDELDPEVDDTRHARYWQEAYYGVVMRMGLLALVLGAME
jgi:aspartate carbamoyltransferase catalytic subunit